MELSNDLISQFAKLTSDRDKKKSTETIVYGTTVEYEDRIYVKIDGSDLLTPVETTTDVKGDQRVTILIKDHSATVTGNITDPSVGQGKVDDAKEEVKEEVKEELDGAKEVIKVEVLEAVDAKIENLEVEDLKAVNAEIENLKATKAEITDLTATNAQIENLKATKAEITDLTATNATITNLNADVANIKTLVNGNLTSDNILSFLITADKVTMADAFIKDAHIANINAAKIDAGTINTANVSITSEDGGLSIADETMQFTDENGVVRIQIGRDSNNNFTFVLYDETGRGQLINADGIQSSDAIKDGLIRNGHVSDDAAISGSKLDISSVITEINDDDSTTIKSNKIYLDEKGQSLEVAFNSLSTKVDTIQDTTISGDLTAIMEQVQSNTTEINVAKGNINTLVAENTTIKESIRNLDGELETVNETLSSKYSQLEQDVGKFKTTVSETYATKDTLKNYSTTSQMNSAIEQKATGILSTVSNTYVTNDTLKNYSTTTQMNSAIEQKASGILSTVSNTYVSTDTLKNYSTTTQMNSAIEQKASGILSTVSSTYTTKNEVNDKLQGLKSNNLVRNGGFIEGTKEWVDAGGGMTRGATYNTACGYYVDTNYPNGFYSNHPIWLQNNKEYTFSAKVWPYVTTEMTDRYPLYPCINTNLSDTMDSSCYTIISKSHTSIPGEQWSTISITFRVTKTNVYFRPYFYHGGSWDTMSISDVQLVEGTVVPTWTANSEDNLVINYATKSELNQTADSWTATFESGYNKGIVEMNQWGIKVTHSDFSGWSHMTSSGFYVHNGTEDVVMCTTDGLTVKGTLTASNIYGSYMASDSSSTPTFFLNSSGEIFGAKIDCESLAADGVISTSTLIVDNISNKAYPKALVAGGTIYVNSSTGDDSNEFKSGNKFATLQGAIDSIPKNMNGKTIKIQLENNVTEDIDINYFSSGTLSLYCNGKTIYGYINVKGCSSYVYILGGDTSSSSASTGVVHPKTGIDIGDRTSSIGAVQSNYVSIQYMKVYGADNQASGLTGNKVCVAGMTAANIYINTVAVTKTDVGFRVSSMASMHMNKSSGVASTNGFQALTGGKISFSNNSQTGGKENATYSSTGGQIWLGSSTTFESGSATTDTTTAPSTTVTKTVTYTANYADTYRSTVYNNWKKDGTARQGNWGYGNCTGCWFFGDDFEGIAKKTITKVEITFKRQSGGYNASKTHYFYTHSHEGRPSGSPTLGTAIGSASAAVGETVTYTITNSTYISAIKSAKGIAIRDTAYSKDKYSVCSGTMKVKFTYTVTT